MNLQDTYNRIQSKSSSKMMNPFNALPNDKYFVLSKLKAIADNKTNVCENSKFVMGCVKKKKKNEDIVGKGENAG